MLDKVCQWMVDVIMYGTVAIAFLSIIAIFATFICVGWIGIRAMIEKAQDYMQRIRNI